jgi:hypothetical protein
MKPMNFVLRYAIHDHDNFRPSHCFDLPTSQTISMSQYIAKKMFNYCDLMCIHGCYMGNVPHIVHWVMGGPSFSSISYN